MVQGDTPVTFFVYQPREEQLLLTPLPSLALLTDDEMTKIKSFYDNELAKHSVPTNALKRVNKLLTLYDQLMQQPVECPAVYLQQFYLLIHSLKQVLQRVQAQPASKSAEKNSKRTSPVPFKVTKELPYFMFNR